MRIQFDAFPLAADVVVGQIVEHAVQTVATKQRILGHHIAVGRDARAVVEIQRRIADGQRGVLFDLDAVAVDDDGPRRLNHRILPDHQTVQSDGIPAVRPQVDALLDTTLQRENKIVLHQLRLVGVVLAGGNLDEHQQTVALAHLEVGAHGVQIRAIDIHAVTALVAAFQSGGDDADAVARLVMHPESLGR